MNKEFNQKSHENSINSATGSRILLKNEDFQAKHNQNQGNSLKNSQKSDEARKNADNSRILAESDVNSGISNESLANTSDLSKKEENREKVKKIHEHKEFLTKSGDNSMNLSQSAVNSVISKENVAKSSYSTENTEEAMDFKQSNENSAKAEESIENSANVGEKADNSIDMGENVENIRNSEAKATSLKDFFNIDSENELKSQFPSVNIENLRNNKDFNELLRLIIQNPTLAQVCSCFNAIVSSTEEHSRKKLAYALASANSGVGSLSSSSKTEQAFFTKEQVLNMSQEEIRRNYTKIRQSQQHW